VLGDKIKVMWGKGTDSSSSRNRPVRVTDGHVSVIGHITMKELVKKLSDIDMASGFGNRFLWLYSERKQLLPRGAPLRLKNFEIEMAWLRECLQWSSEADWSVPISMTSEAWDLWESEGLYAHLGRPRPGVLDELTARAEPQVRRIAIIFALLEKETVVSRQHLEAAHAFWDYCERTAAAIWGCAPEHETDTKILAALRLMPDGMSKTELTRKVFSGHISGDDLSKSLAGLLRACLIKQKKIKKHGRSAVVFCLA